MRLDGVVDNPKYAFNDAQRGKPYSYRVNAQFDEASGARRAGNGPEL
ncbi:MAG: hypothetical protein ABIO45_00445 [Burkholderiaceae bacterium]